jgi:hypothetical protein
MIVFFFVITTLFNQGSSYLGIVIYIALPGLLVTGLVLIPIGMLGEIKRQKKGIPEKEKLWPLIDFNNYRHRNAFMIFSVGSMIFLLLSAVGSYEAFHYTESVEFCVKNLRPARETCEECHWPQKFYSRQHAGDH